MKKIMMICWSIMAICSADVFARDINPGESIYSGSGVYSDNGQNYFTMQTDGNLVMYSPSGAIWSSKTSGSGGVRATLGTDGNFGIYRSDNSAVWTTSTFKTASILSVQDDGNVAMYYQRPIWTSNTASPNEIQSNKNYYLPSGSTFNAGNSVSNGQYFFILQSDGNLVLYKNGGSVIWSTNTQNRGIDHASMQGDGNFVLYARTTPIWSTSTSAPENNGSVFVVQNDGNLVMYAKTVNWDLRSGPNHPGFKDHSGPGKGFGFTPGLTIAF
jgi:hypothetical protein